MSLENQFKWGDDSSPQNIFTFNSTAFKELSYEKRVKLLCTLIQWVSDELHLMTVQELEQDN